MLEWRFFSFRFCFFLDFSGFSERAAKDEHILTAQAVLGALALVSLSTRANTRAHTDDIHPPTRARAHRCLSED